MNKSNKIKLINTEDNQDTQMDTPESVLEMTPAETTTKDTPPTDIQTTHSTETSAQASIYSLTLHPLLCPTLFRIYQPPIFNSPINSLVPSIIHLNLTALAYSFSPAIFYSPKNKLNLPDNDLHNYISWAINYSNKHLYMTLTCEHELRTKELRD